MKRNASLDIIRGFAVVLVACLHSIGNGSLTANHISGVSGYLLTGLWLLSASCVPLFLMLSGYLQNRKMPTVKYYVNYLHIYIPYLLLGVICLYHILSHRESYKLGHFTIEERLVATFRSAVHSLYVDCIFAQIFHIGGTAAHLNVRYIHLYRKLRERNLPLRLLFSVGVAIVTARIGGIVAARHCHQSCHPYHKYAFYLSHFLLFFIS